MDDTQPMDTEAVQDFLVNLLRQLALIPLEELERIKPQTTDLTMFHTIMPMLDPSEYRRVLSSGELEHGQLQMDCLNLFIELRKNITAMDDLARKAQSGKAIP